MRAVPCLCSFPVTVYGLYKLTNQGRNKRQKKNFNSQAARFPGRFPAARTVR
ncbi:hypothetical protein HMPREF3293_00763 [Christensenella minuta]|uniref:Uncharacterized protein n=1 Tax=Christensenella minuta TaxID=626937 RepID=A0A136Q6Q2_9FIRM|nr:hypothetical protein HMPREF3293_00763 [Christensenella minuta]